MKKNLFTLPLVVMLAGCSGTLDMVAMARDSGKTYTGWLYGEGDGTGNAEMTIEGVVFSGPAIRSSNFEMTEIATQYGAGDYAPKTPITRTTKDMGGNVGVRLLLHSKDGQGLRCEFQGIDGRGSGICIDDKNKVYDVILKIR
jgi:hypothetical protein